MLRYLPLFEIFKDRDKREFIGFGMRKIRSDYSFVKLYQYPPDNKLGVDMKTKVDLLIDLAGIVAKFHHMGPGRVVIGDFNQKNIIKVSGINRVALLDADSLHLLLQRQGRPSMEFKCSVCMPGYVAPELMRKTRGGIGFGEIAGESFTYETDRFSLAIHVFRMLMNGAHPYHCAPVPKDGGTGSLPAPMPIDKRVERAEIPFFTTVQGAKIPEWVPSLDALPPYIRDLFKKAFVDGTRYPEKRPTAGDWRVALAKYKKELVQCRKNHLHWYHKDNGSSCPYCAAEKSQGKIDQKATRQIAKTTPAPSTDTSAVTRGIKQVSPSAQNSATGVGSGNQVAGGSAKRSASDVFEVGCGIGCAIVIIILIAWTVSNCSAFIL